MALINVTMQEVVTELAALYLEKARVERDLDRANAAKAALELQLQGAQAQVQQLTEQASAVAKREERRSFFSLRRGKR